MRAPGRRLFGLLAVLLAVVGATAGAASARTQLPNTTITSAPSGTVASTTASFSFTANSASSFLCSLDGGSWTSCSSPKRYSSLANGHHTFAVRAVNKRGADPTPATAQWTIDTLAPPVPDITAAPASPANASSASLSFSDSEAGVTFICALDGAAAKLCTSPVVYTNLADGPHTFAVSARDGVGNTSAPRTATWVADTTPPPAPAIGSGPNGATASTAAQLSFSDAESGVAFLCALDGSAPQACSSPASYGGLALGTHIFSVVARDAAGNTSDAAKDAWAVQTDYFSNGSFEGSLAGWSSAAGTLSLAADGVVGSSAAKVTVAQTNQGWVSIFPSPRPVQGTVSGYIYRASAWVRSDAPANSVCLRIREYTPGNSLVNTVAECTTSSQQWQQFPTMTYTPTTVGNVVTAFVYQPSPVAGGTYEVDGVSIIGGPPALFAGNGDPVLLAGGDVACAPDSPAYNFGLGTGTQCMHSGTTALIGTVPGLQYLLPLGDEQYECGELSNFNSVYNLTWGRYRSISRPVPGNHEYGVTSTGACPATTQAEGYFAYFGAIAGDPTKGYYSYDVGNWHIVALNSTCVVVSCAAGSQQEVWLRNDLAAHPATCTLAYWHQPRWSTGQVGDESQYDAFTRDLVNAHVELMLSGHDHTYQRWTPMNAAGVADPNGVREVVAGTGGEELFPILGSRPTLEAANNTTFGLVQLVLHPNGYDAQFVATAGGGFTDTFSGSCH